MVGMVEISITDNNSKITCKLSEDRKLISYCTITRDNTKWNITSWFTHSPFQGKRYGKASMRELFYYCICKYGEPTEIQYTWNGQNSYVYDWMTKHFDATCSCPLFIQKNSCDDDWESHLYNLNVNKFLDYLGIGE